MVKLRRRTGYTMIEMLIVVSVVGLITSVAAGIFVQVTRYFIFTRARIELQREARASMYVITRELRQGQSATIVVDRYSSGQPLCSRITFTRAQGNQAVFFQQGGNLVMNIGNNQKILSPHLQYLAFTFPRSDDLTILSVSLTLQEIIYQGRRKALHMASQQVQVEN